MPYFNSSRCWEFDLIIIKFYHIEFAAKFISYFCNKSSRQKQNNDNVYKIGYFLQKFWIDGKKYRNVPKK